MSLSSIVARLQSIGMTETRAHWLERVGSSTHWVRRDAQTLDLRAGRKMPEPVYFWMVENELIDSDCGRLSLSAEGQTLVDLK